MLIGKFFQNPSLRRFAEMLRAWFKKNHGMSDGGEASDAETESAYCVAVRTRRIRDLRNAGGILKR
jgi:hypothetical protein